MNFLVLRTTWLTHPPVQLTKVPLMSRLHDLSQIVSRSKMSRVATHASLDRADRDAIRQETVKQQASHPLTLERTSDNRILVIWYTTDNQANPSKLVSEEVGARHPANLHAHYASYIAGAIITPAIPTIIENFELSHSVASLCLSIHRLWG